MGLRGEEEKEDGIEMNCEQGEVDAEKNRGGDREIRGDRLSKRDKCRNIMHYTKASAHRYVL